MTNKCNSCLFKCNSQDSLHTHHYDNDVCTCEQCNCDKSKAQDKTYESGGLVIDDTGECESCQ